MCPPETAPDCFDAVLSSDRMVSGLAGFYEQGATRISFAILELDSDSDGVGDSVDNCTDTANPDQRDTDGDGHGNMCDADLNNDCIVNAIDLGFFRSVFFTPDPDADFNGDGVVNAIDLGTLKRLFFAPTGPSAPGALCN
jgi:hypothetical protein